MDKKHKNRIQGNAPSQLKEGVHYYFEDGLMVFTEKYHLIRGYCCNSGCRHCPFKEKKK